MAAGGRFLAQPPARACDAQTLDLVADLDLVTDGESNDGPSAANLPGIAVNVLAIGGEIPLDHDGAVDSLSHWCAETVIQGPGSFVLIANGFEGFSDAMRRKLLRELSPLLSGAALP